MLFKARYYARFYTFNNITKLKLVSGLTLLRTVLGRLVFRSKSRVLGSNLSESKTSCCNKRTLWYLSIYVQMSPSLFLSTTNTCSNCAANQFIIFSGRNLRVETRLGYRQGIHRVNKRNDIDTILAQHLMKG